MKPSHRDLALVCLVAVAACAATGSPTQPEGAAPHSVLAPEAVAALKRILAPYKPEALSAEDAQAIQRAMHGAGLQPSPALDRAMADAGFSTKRLQALSPWPQAPASAASGGSLLRLPRRQ